MNKKIFEEKYSKDFANPRNLTAGLIKNEAFDHYEDLRFIAYDTNKTFNTENEKWAWLHNTGFDAVETLGVPNVDWIIKYRNSRNPKDREYAIDGLILRQDKIDPKDAAEILPKKIHAFKWRDIPEVTTLRSVEWSLTGSSLTPIACFDAVELEGTEVKRASLSNPSYITSMGLKIGDKIEVTKHGQIIPHVDRVVEHCGAEEIEFPKMCPECGRPLTMRDNYKKLYCDNNLCKTHFSARLAKWMNVFDVKGFGPAMQKVAIDLGFTTIPSIYSSEAESKITEVVGVNATKAYKNLRDAKSKATLAKVVAGYNLSNIGIELAQTIEKAGFNVNNIWDIKPSDLVEIDGWSNIRANSFVEAFNEVKDEMSYLVKNILPVDEVSISRSDLSGKHFCITGKLLNYKRKEIEAMVIEKGAILDSNVTSKTDFLVTNDVTTGSTKLQAAEKYNTLIINENDLLKMLGKN